MKRYVICLPHRIPIAMMQYIMLVEKKKPAWQAGLYNLVGGSIEEGEDPRDAAIRELWEESGIRGCHAEVCGEIVGEDYQVVACRVWYRDWFNGGPQKIIPGLTSERVFEMRYDEALASDKLIPNLRVIIPLMMTGVKGWQIIDNFPYLRSWTMQVDNPPEVIKYRAA